MKRMLNYIIILAICVCILFDIILSEISIFPYVWIVLNYIIFRIMICLYERNKK